MKMSLNRRGTYFDTYYIRDEEGNRVGIIEDHCRGVKTQYFVAWKMDTPNGNVGKTDVFGTIEEAMIYSVGVVVSDY